MAEEKIEALIAESGASDFAVTIQVSGHELRGDEPVAAGGADTGPSPYDFLLSALGSCTAMTVRWYARKHRWPLDKVEVRVTHHKREIAGQPQKEDVFEKFVTLHGDALSAEQRNKLHEVAAKCPVQRTLEATPVIHSS